MSKIEELMKEIKTILEEKEKQIRQLEQLLSSKDADAKSANRLKLDSENKLAEVQRKFDTIKKALDLKR